MSMTASKKYIRNVRRLITVYGKAERKFIGSLQNDLQSYCEDHPESSDYDSIVRKFGSPRDMYINYLESQDDRYIIRSIGHHKIIRNTLFILCICFAVMTAIAGYHYHQVDRSFREGLPASFSETIEVISGPAEEDAAEK